MNWKCPLCKKDVLESDAEFPFCSERCRTLDLGNWASEKYKVVDPDGGADICPACDSTGEVDGQLCKACQGKGYA